MRRSDAFDTPLLDIVAIRAFLRRQAAMIGGLALIGTAALAVVALATWSVADPSLSHATAAPVTNFLGLPGAIFADLAMQLFGLGTIALLVPMVIWGWHLMTDGAIDRKGRRIGYAFGFALGVCATLSLLPLFGAWPLPIGLGGLAGDALSWLPRVLLPIPFVAELLVAALALPAAWLCLTRTAFRPDTTPPPGPADMRIQPRRIHRAGALDGEDTADEWDEDDNWDDEMPPEDDRTRLQVALGHGTHMLYSAGATLRRLTSRRNAHPPVRPDLGTLNARLRASDPVMEDEYAPTEHAQQVAPAWEAQLAPIDPAPVQAVAEPALYDQQPVAESAFTTPPLGEPVQPEPVEDDWTGFEPAPPYEAALPLDMPPEVGQPEPMAPEPVAPQRTPPRVADMVQMRPGKRAAREAQPSLLGDNGTFDLPPLRLLAKPKTTGQGTLSPKALERNAGLLEGVLEDFRVTGEVINVCPGPVVTLYEFEPAPGIKSARVIGLADDIARSMSAISARVAVIPGRNAIGIELPNTTRETVYLSEILASQNFEKAKGNLPLALGKTIGGEPVIADLARMPHLLVAGTTGSGKSVSINTMILSILYRWTPEECRLILIDPKMLELSVYDGIPHLLTPVVTDPGKAVTSLKWAVREMEDRYRKMSKLGVRNIDGFNARVKEAAKKGEIIHRTVQTGFDAGTGEPVYEREELAYEAMPMLVIVVDEMADLMMVAGKEIEGAIQRLAQMARAAGIHIIMATQRPSVDVITGTIKANFPTRCSFQVTSKIDSRTILGEQGAEQLLGQGDMLFMAGGGRIQRVHGPFVSDEEVESVVSHLKAQGAPDYLHTITEEPDEEDDDPNADPTEKSIARLAKSDDPYEQAIAIVMRDKKASTSYIQRRLGIGYNRAASIIEKMEKEGLIGPANHAGKREVLIQGMDEEEVFDD